ncbi:helix-turn-helix domain-containing protein [Enterococcus hulanensis]|uniref:helix-turn-helix domain-containing protein n=1 Tax=Enterococcus hulanensis TaxID=2559929 RepID=UPI001A8C1792|nr:helix-turn-helix domain-containing protein [Enterococcus hulanensis]MBO0458110.1 helix-turn-helix domain-containing protein [Enterococcus hulanensis]
MKELLDSKSKKKIEIIEKIFHSSGHSCAQSDLLGDLNLTYPTLISMNEGINDDLLGFGYESFSITRHSSNQSYSIDVKENMSIQLVIHAYIRESSKFKLLVLLLSSSYPNLDSLSKRLYISYSSIRRDIKDLNQFLSKYNLKISVKDGVQLEGDELGIRLFYTILFLTTYGGELWPFSYIQYFEITKILEKCPKEIYIAGSIDKSMLVHYYFAIHLLRVRKRYLIPETRSFEIALYTPYPKESIEAFDIFTSNLNKYLPNLNRNVLTLTSRLLLSTVLAMGNYSPIEKVPPFFYFEDQLKDKKILETAIFIVDLVDQHLSIPFSNREKEKLLYSLLSITYRFYLFNGVSLDLSSAITGFAEIQRNIRKKHKMDHMRELVRQMMDREELSIFEPFRKDLEQAYLLILEKRIDFSKHTLPIKVAIFSVVSNENAVFDFMSYFSNYYNVRVVDSVETDIDLFISDFVLSPQVMSSLRISQPIVYVNTRWIDSDYEKINTALAEIATENFINI